MQHIFRGVYFLKHLTNKLHTKSHLKVLQLTLLTASNEVDRYRCQCTVVQKGHEISTTEGCVFFSEPFYFSCDSSKVTNPLLRITWYCFHCDTQKLHVLKTDLLQELFTSSWRLEYWTSHPQSKCCFMNLKLNLDHVGTDSNYKIILFELLQCCYGRHAYPHSGAQLDWSGICSGCGFSWVSSPSTAAVKTCFNYDIATLDTQLSMSTSRI